MDRGWEELNDRIVSCGACPRLRGWCTQVAREKRAAFRDEDYWGRPVPNFGDAQGWLLLVGLAPAAHGANRTGRMFTGDRSGDFLYEALHACGLASQPTAIHAGDGLLLRGCAITAACHCAPPANKPTTAEFAACAPFLDATVRAMPRLRAICCLGALALGQVLALCIRMGWPLPRPRPAFAHGAVHTFAVPQGGPLIACTYHPSQQNTFTGLLTQEMLRNVLRDLQVRMQEAPGTNARTGFPERGSPV